MYDKLIGGFNVLALLLPYRNKDYFNKSPRKLEDVRQMYLEGDFSKKIHIKKKPESMLLFEKTVQAE